MPSNLTLLALPPRSPQLDPAEMLWRELRQRYLSNRVLADLEVLVQALGQAWCRLTDEPARLVSLCNFDWIRSARQQATAAAGD